MKFKNLPLCFVTACFLAGIVFGCSTTQQTTAYETISGIETTATVAYGSYIDAVIGNRSPTNNVPGISQAYDSLQAALKLAAATSEAGTNAIAPANLVTEGTDFLNLITPLIPK